jgi:RHS repeat-associated protein
VVSFDYDDAGNLTRGKTADGTWRRYTYDQAGHLTRVSDDNGNTLEEYNYAPGNVRLASTASGLTTLYVSDGVHTLSEYQRSGQKSPWSWQHSSLFLGDRRVAELDNGSADGEVLTYLHAGRLGVRLLTNTKDSSYRKQVTLPFGTVLQPMKATNPVFTGYDRSAVTGVDYAINRDYDAQERRFIQVDPQRPNLLNPRSLNLYAYVGNDPINRTDSTGLQPDAGVPQNVFGGTPTGWVGAAKGVVTMMIADEAGGYVGDLGTVYGVFEIMESQNVNRPPQPDPLRQIFSPGESISSNNFTISPGTTSIGTTSMNRTFESAGGPTTYGTTITVTDNLGFTQQTTIMATNYSDHSSVTTITGPDGSQTTNITASNGDHMTISTDANGNSRTSTTDINGNATNSSGVCSSKAGSAACPKTN